MTTPYQSGEWVEYFSLEDKSSWKRAYYIGPRGKDQHALELPGSGNIIIKGDCHVRTISGEQSLTGFMIIYRNRQGAQVMVGPVADDIQLRNALAERTRIYPSGPEAVLDLSKLNLSYNIGDGVPAAFLRKRPQPITGAGVQ